MASLQDQLLGAGLINKQKAKKIQSAKKKAANISRKTKVELENKAADLAKKAEEEKRLRSQALNAKKKQEAEQKAITAQIRQIIELNSIEKSNGKNEQAYNFTDDAKIKTLYVSSKNHELMSRGILAIAKLDNSYHLIPKDAAKKINERDSQSIVLLNDLASSITDAVESDDPYADYQIPDDLMW
ncbi:MAG: DUF2058 domain-containing protein [Bacteroidetes bacterium]|nr:MAG: DUF2058 domain-containing protein [Bacteroidota bacterium]